MKYNVDLVRKFLEDDPDLHIDENPDLEGVHSIPIWWTDIPQSKGKVRHCK